MEKLPKTEDLQSWLEEFVIKNEPPSDYDKTMARLAVRLAEKGKRISSQEIKIKMQAAQIRDLASDIVEPAEE
jgi:site-specific recombinase XerC